MRVLLETQKKSQSEMPLRQCFMWPRATKALAPPTGPATKKFGRKSQARRACEFPGSDKSGCEKKTVTCNRARRLAVGSHQPQNYCFFPVDDKPQQGETAFTTNAHLVISVGLPSAPGVVAVPAFSFVSSAAASAGALFSTSSIASTTPVALAGAWNEAIFFFFAGCVATQEGRAAE